MGFEVSPLLDRQALMQDIAEHMGRLGKRNRPGTDLTGHPAMDPAGVGDDYAVDLSGFADHQHIGLDIAFHDTVDLDLAGTDEVTDDLEIVRENGWRRG